jgi:hypothetical protein
VGGTTEQYLEGLEQELYRRQQAEKETPVTVTPGAPAVDPKFKDLEEAAVSTAQTSIAAKIEAQYASYKVDQMDLKEEERSSLTRTELTDILKGPAGAVVKDMVDRDKEGEFQGNYFIAATEYKRIIDGMPAARKAGADSAEALRKAKETAEIPAGTAALTPGSDEAQLADFVADMSPPDPEATGP